MCVTLDTSRLGLSSLNNRRLIVSKCLPTVTFYDPQRSEMLSRKQALKGRLSGRVRAKLLQQGSPNEHRT